MSGIDRRSNRQLLANSATEPSAGGFDVIGAGGRGPGGTRGPADADRLGEARATGSGVGQECLKEDR
jgi:hypothetical protein